MIEPGRIIIMVRAGTSGDSVRGFAPRWVSDPTGTYRAEVDKGRTWCDRSGVAFEHCLYHPGGARPLNSPGVMELNQYPLLHATNPEMAEAIADEFRAVTMAGKEGEFHAVYLGSPAAFEWKRRSEVRACFVPFAVAGRSSVVLDQLAGTRENPFISIPKNTAMMDELAFAFQTVIGEGGIGSNSWLTVPVMHTADAHEEIYTHRPDLYVWPKWILVSNVPKSMREEKSTREEKTAWKIAQCRLWLPRGVNVVIEANEVEGLTYTELLEA